MPHKEYIRLHRFDVSRIKRGSNFFICGKRNCGKTNFLKYLMSFLVNKGGFGKVAVICPTEKYNKTYAREFGIDPDFIRPDFDEEFLERLLLVQQDIVSNLDASEKRNMKHWMLFVLDDVAFDKRFQRNLRLQEMMMNGRHFMSCVIQLAQDPYTPEKRTRTCYDYVISLRDNTVNGQQSLYLNYYGMFPSHPVFTRTLMHYTADYGVLIADNTRQCAHIGDQYNWDRAPNLSGRRVVLHLDYQDAEPYRAFIRDAPSEALDAAAMPLGKRKRLSEQAQLDERKMEMQRQLQEFYATIDSQSMQLRTLPRYHSANMQRAMVEEDKAKQQQRRQRERDQLKKVHVVHSSRRHVQ